jgi:hypothetical protein
MLDEHKSIINQGIKDLFLLKKETNSYERELNTQLLFFQLDLFKNIATLSLALLSITFAFGTKIFENTNHIFLTLSVFLYFCTLVITISYTRELIDLRSSELKEGSDAIKEKTDRAIEVAVESIKKGKSELYFNFAEGEIKNYDDKVKLNYAGEIITFLFYLGISFEILSFLAKYYDFSPLSTYICLAILFSYLLSFKAWSVFLIELFSSHIPKNLKSISLDFTK